MNTVERKRRADRGNVVKQARLEYRNPAKNSRKFYEIYLEESPNGNDTYVIRTAWGRIGTRTPMSQVKDVQGSIVDALATFHDWIGIKENKGYKRIDS